MRKIISTKAIAMIIAVFSMAVQSFAQCPNNNVNYGTISSINPGSSATVSCMYGGERATVAVVSGSTYTFSTCGGGIWDSQLSIYNASTGAYLAYNDDFCGAQSQVTWTANFTGNVYVNLDRYFCSNQNSCMNLTVTRSGSAPAPAPANDLCANATSLPCGTSNLAGTTVGTTTTGDANAFSSSYGVWYTFVGNGQNTTITSVAGSGYDHEMTIYSGSCASKTFISSQDVGFSGGTESYSFSTVNGTTYYVYVAHWSTSSTATGTFTISRTCTAPPANPCTSATALTCGTAASYSLAAGNGAWNPTGPFGTPGNEKVFTFTPTVTGNYNVAVTNDNYYVDLFQATSCGANTWTYINDISTSGETNTVALNAGTTYYFLLDDENTTASAGTITVSTALGTPVISGNTQLCGTGTTIQGYSFAAVSGATSYTWSVSGVGMILQGGSVGTAGVNKNITFNGAFTSGTLTLTANSACGSTSTTVNIQRAGGDFVINSFPYTNSSSTLGAANNFTFSGSPFWTADSEERAYKVEVSCAANYTFSLCGGATWDTYLVLTSDICSNPSVIAYNDDNCGLQSEISVNLTPGTYYLMVEGYSATSAGDYTLNVTQAPPTMDAISGLTSICGAGAASGTLSVAAVSGATSYTWTLPAGMTGSSTTNTIAVTADASFNGGTVSVSAATCAGVASQSVNVTRTIEDVTVSNQFSNTNNNVGNGNASSLRASEDVIYKWDVTCPGTYTVSTCGGATWDTYLYLISDLPCNSFSTLASNDDNCSLQSSFTATVAAGTYYIVVEGFSSTSGGAYTLNVTGETPVVSINNVSNYNGFGVSCNGGSNGTASSSAVNGTGMEYSIDGGANYQSSGDFSGLSAGSYTITARNCVGNTASASFTVTEPTVLNANAAVSDEINCNGETGEITVFAAGGVAPYAGTGTNVVLAGDYTYTVTDANGCTASVDISITEPTVLVASSVVSDAINCNGETGVITVSATGGTPAYVGTGDNTVSAGTYTYTVTDANGCTAETTTTITEPTVLTVNAGGDETVFYGYGPMECADLSAVGAGGTPDYNYSWTSIVSGGGMGADVTVCPETNEVYTVTVTDANGCSASDELSICVVNVECEAGNSGNMKVEMCQIPPGNPNNAHTICIDASAVPAHLAIGCVLGACGELDNCNYLSGMAVQETALKGSVLSTEMALTAYPNPTRTATTISLTSVAKGDYTVVMTDMTGRVIETIYNGFMSDYENMTFDVDMSSLTSGIYLVNVIGSNGIMNNLKIVKE